MLGVEKNHKRAIWKYENVFWSWNTGFSETETMEEITHTHTQFQLLLCKNIKLKGRGQTEQKGKQISKKKRIP